MTAIELFDGFARAVEMAKPAQEFCLADYQHWSTCMTKAEWASWAQAFFSVFGIGIAIAAPYLQAFIQEKIEKKKLMKLVRDNFRRSRGDFEIYPKFAKHLVEGIASADSIEEARVYISIFIRNISTYLCNESDVTIYESAGKNDEGFLFAEALRRVIDLRNELVRDLSLYETSSGIIADETNLNGLKMFADRHIRMVFEIFVERFKLVERSILEDASN